MTTSARQVTPQAPDASGCAPTRRLSDLPTYVFAWLDELKAAGLLDPVDEAYEALNSPGEAESPDEQPDEQDGPGDGAHEALLENREESA